jgi:ABC-type transport system substrate-binding protein
MTTPPGSGLVGAAHRVAFDRRKFMQLLGASAGAAALAGCTTGDDPEGDGGTTRAPTSDRTIAGPEWQGGIPGGIGVSLWPDPSLVYDPPLAYGQGDYYGLHNVYRGLTFYGGAENVELDQAESVDLSDDGLQYTFTLREGVTFHNGRAVTAEDYKWTFERSSSKEIESWVQGFLASVKGHAEFVDGKADQISGIVAQDERTLVMTLTKPDVTIMGVVGIPPFYVLPREEVEAFGEDWPQNPVGTGPFKLKSWDNGQRVVTFEKYEDYVFGPELPYLDEVEYRYGVSDDVAFLTVARNEADLALNVPASAIPRIKENAEQSERFKEWGSYTLSYWQFDVSKPPFDDVRVRQAVNHAFNRERTEALGYVADGHFYPAGLIGYNESAEVFAYDPDRARELLAEAGVSDGDISFTMPVFGTNVAPRLSQLLQADLKEVGIEVELEQLDLTPYDIGAELPEKYPLWGMGWGMGLPDPSELISSLVGTGAPSNFGGYGNPRIDELGVQAISEADPDARAALYAEIESILLADAAFLFFGTSAAPSFTSASLENFSYEPVLRTYWDRYWKSEA